MTRNMADTIATVATGEEMLTSQYEMIATLEALQAKEETPSASKVPATISPKGKSETCLRDRHSGEIKCGDMVAR